MKNDFLYREIFDLASDGIFLVSQEGTCIDVNKAACDMLGFEKAELLQLPMKDSVSVSDFSEILKLADFPRIQPAESSIKRKDGTLLAVRVEVRSLQSGNLIVWVQDITEQKMLEEQVRLARQDEIRRHSKLQQISEATHHISEAVGSLPTTDLAAVLQTILRQAQTLTLAEMGAVGIMSSSDKPFDPWVFTGVSDDLLKHIGHFPRPVGVLGEVAIKGEIVRLKELSEHPAYQGLPPGHPAIHSFLGVPIVFRGKSLGNIYLANKKDGKEFSLEDRVTLELLANRVSSAVEIAKHYRSESLERSWLTGVIEQMPEGVIVADRTGKVIAQNQVALSLTLENSRGTDAFGNRMDYDVAKPNGEPLTWEELPLLRAIKDKKPYINIELVITDRNKKKIPIMASATPMFDNEKQLLGAVVVFHDISFHKELQRLKEEWISVIAHDLRQPISVISMSADILRQNADQRPSDDAQMIKMIATNASLLNRLTQDLLDASLIEAQRLSIQKKKENFVAIVENAIAHFHQTAPHRQVNLDIMTKDPCFVEVDIQRIEQILNNLLSNATKYSTEDTPIEIAITRQNQNINLSVTNYGRGIPKEHINNLFQRYYRAGSPEETASGIGLGLYIIKGLIEAHGGKIWVESESNKKTTFTISLPQSRQ